MEKAINKIQNSFMIKTHKKLGIKDIYLDNRKAIRDKPTAASIFTMKR